MKDLVEEFFDFMDSLNLPTTEPRPEDTEKTTPEFKRALVRRLHETFERATFGEPDIDAPVDYSGYDG